MKKIIFYGLLSLICAIILPAQALAASDLSLSPASGSYIIGNTFPVIVKINTNGNSINAAEAYLTFDKTKFAISSLDTSSSMFVAWPKLEFSNSAGTIHFAGGLPLPGFSGSSGSVLTINFKGVALGTGDVTYDGGANKPSVLLSDGLATENFGSASGGTYTIIPLPLSVFCSAGSANINNPVTFKASASGESGIYTYLWSGVCTGTSSSCTKTFSSTGSKTATVVATSNGKTATISCSANIGLPGLNAYCSGPDSVDAGTPITFQASASGGDGSYTYSWSGACTGTSTSCTNSLNEAGLKKATVNVVSDGKSTSTDCVFSVNAVCPEVVCPVGGVGGVVENTAPISAIKIIAGLSEKSIKIPEISYTAKTVSTIGIGVAVLPLFEGLFSPLRLLGILLGALGVRKKKHPWGTVYDSVTKQPLDLAYVTLKLADTGKDVSSSITDIDGRYGFFVDPDAYQIAVNKTNYAFPSKTLAGKTKDELYDNLYFGGNINVKEMGEVIVKNIPLDPLKFNWNEFAKKSQKLTKFYSQWDSIIRKSSSPVFYLGLIFAIISFVFAPYLFNSIIIGLYLVMLVLRILGIKSRTQGVIVDKTTGIPSAFAIIRVMMYGSDIEIVSKSADRYGRYYCLVPPGQYYVKIEKKNRDGSYSLVHTSDIIDVTKKGIIKEKFKV